MCTEPSWRLTGKFGAKRTAGNVQAISVDDGQEVFSLDDGDVRELDAFVRLSASHSDLRRTVDVDVYRQRSRSVGARDRELRRMS